jgi:hypothetical protein
MTGRLLCPRSCRSSLRRLMAALGGSGPSAPSQRSTAPSPKRTRLGAILPRSFKLRETGPVVPNMRLIIRLDFNCCCSHQSAQARRKGRTSHPARRHRPRPISGVHRCAHQDAGVLKSAVTFGKKKCDGRNPNGSAVTPTSRPRVGSGPTRWRPRRSRPAAPFRPIPSTRSNDRSAPAGPQRNAPRPRGGPAAAQASAKPPSGFSRPYRAVRGPVSRSYSADPASKLKSPIRTARRGMGGISPSVQPLCASGWVPHHAPPSSGALACRSRIALTCGRRVSGEKWLRCVE